MILTSRRYQVLEVKCVVRLNRKTFLESEKLLRLLSLLVHVAVQSFSNSDGNEHFREESKISFST